MSATSTIAPRATSDSWLKRYPLAAFFVLAFALTWPFLIADALGAAGIIPFRLDLKGPGVLLVLLMGYGPSFAALIVCGATAGRAGIAALLRRLLIWRVGLRWYIVAIAGTAILFAGGSAIFTALGGTLRPAPPLTLELIVMLTVSFVLHGIVNGEELGWRGFALPQLQARMNALSASLVLGAVWALFHLPLFLTLGGGAGGNQASIPVIPFALQIVATSVMVTWIFNNTRGSVLLATFIHAGANTWGDIFSAGASDERLAWIQAGLTVAVAIVVVVAYGAEQLRRDGGKRVALTVREK